MRIPRDEQFGEQAAKFSLRFNCESCALFDEVRERCAHGFPTEEHRAKRYEDDPGADVIFCKEWESV
jgi:hypothetical protein